MFTSRFTIADCHCDTIFLLAKNEYDFARRNSTGHIDLPRLREGGVDLQFFAVCTASENKSSCLQSALIHIANYHRCLAANSEHITGLENMKDMAAAQQEGKIAAVLALEGAEPLEGSPELLDIFYCLGVRALSLTWNHRNHFAGGTDEDTAGEGLTHAGRALVRELGGKGIILDLAHISKRCYFEALELSEKPPLVSHANARQLCDHPRNLTDEQLKALANRGGVIGLSIYPTFISGEAKATLEQLLDHFVHIAGLIGAEHLAFGSDFDGIHCTVEEIKDVSDYNSLPRALCRRGFHPGEVKLMAWDNVNRILKHNIDGGSP